jgi:Zn-dependent M28 family amino/carboxypeptidase
MRWAAIFVALAMLAAAAAAFYMFMTQHPRRSHTGPLPRLTSDQARLRDRLRLHVEAIASGIGGRSLYERYSALAGTVTYIAAELQKYGLTSARQPFTVSRREVVNVETEIRGSSKPDEVVIFGAHYDTAGGLPGANDNTSGVAAVLAMAERVRQLPERTVRFVFFVNEEPPFFQSSEMGSYVYAERSRQRGENIVAMLSIETIGYYSDLPDSQEYPFGHALGFPSTANFIGFVSDLGSRSLLSRIIRVFRDTTPFPSEGIAAPASIPGVGWSDHWAFWQFDYPAAMVTDTALYRYPHYHTSTDTPDKLDYDSMARVVGGLERILADLAGIR